MQRSSEWIYVPSGLSSIFQICYTGKREIIFEGAKGGGFRLKLGTRTKAIISDKNEVYINGEKVEAKTTFKVIEIFKKKFGIEENFKIIHEIEVPIGCGFGTSASGALGASFAIAELLGIKMNFCELANIAHEADILAVTGLGTVSGLASFKGSVGLIIKPGGPCVCETKQLEVDEEDILVALVFSSFEKSKVLLSEDMKKKINGLAEKLIPLIEREGNAYSLLNYSRIFAERTGLMDEELKKVCDFMLKKGFKGATQNMIGRAVHGLIDKRKMDFVEELKNKFDAKIIVSELQEENPLIKSYYY